MKKLNEILLVDDNEADNFYHKRVIQKLGCAERVVEKSDGRQALDYLTARASDGHPLPDIVFLDVNMPVMNGWEFLDGLGELSPEQRGRLVVVMLAGLEERGVRTTPADMSIGFQTKPVKRDVLVAILAEHFPDIADAFRAA